MIPPGLGHDTASQNRAPLDTAAARWRRGRDRGYERSQRMSSPNAARSVAVIAYHPFGKAQLVQAGVLLHAPGSLLAGLRGQNRAPLYPQKIHSAPGA